MNSYLEGSPWDWGAAAAEGQRRGTLSRANREAKGYLDAGDYETAAKTLLPHDPEQAAGYLSFGKRKADQDYSSGVTPYLAKNDFEGAKQYAVSKGRPADDLMKLESWASSAKDQEKKALAEKIDMGASALYAASQLAESGDTAGWESALGELAGQGYDVKSLQGRPYNRAQLQAELVKSRKGLEILGVVNADRKIDIAERRADAAEQTANAAMLKASQGDGRPKPPPGYRWTPAGDMEAIPGGPAALKENAARTKAAGQKRKADLLVSGMEASTENVLDAIGKARELSRTWLATGAGAALTGRIGSTDTNNLAKQIDTIKSNLGFDKLAEMRASSPTGGALGAVTERELDLLQSVVASLDQSQTDEQLRENLDKVERHYRNTLARMKAAYAEDYADEQAAPPLSGRKPQGEGQRLTPEQAAALPSGTPFIGMDGKQRVRK